MLRIVIIVSVMFSCELLPAQIFTRITTGDIVNDGSYSEGTYWFDYNNDGNLDLFVANIINQNNLLFLNNGNSTFTKITSGAIVNDGGFSYGGCIGDYNNDGYCDFYVINGGASTNQANFLYINNGNSTFTKITTGNVVTDVAGSWGSATDDYDNDGNLDIFVSNYNQNNFLYKGIGDGTFTKILTGSIVNDGGGSLGAAWCDYDNDGYRDLFVANANFGAGQVNFLYRNNTNGTFTKITTGDIVTDVANSVGGSWADYDNDGDFDLFVTNYSGTNNNLYRNIGNGTFTKVTTGAIVNDGGSSVGAAWGDIDNDGDLDLFVSNDLNENNFLYINNNDGSFTKVTSGDIVNNGGRSNGCTWGDYDRDGDIDLYVTNGDQPTAQNNFLYRNDGNANKWINILLKGVTSNRSAIGARVTLSAIISGVRVRQVREVSGQTGYNAQNSLNAEFGLGNSTIIDTIIVKWPNGNSETFTNIQVNQFITITEGQGISPVDPNGSNVPAEFELKQNFPNPFNPSTTIEYSMSKTQDVKLTVYNCMGQKIRDLFEGKQSAGRYSIDWSARNENGSDLPSGVYFLKLTAGDYSRTIKMNYLK